LTNSIEQNIIIIGEYYVSFAYINSNMMKVVKMMKLKAVLSLALCIALITGVSIFPAAAAQSPVTTTAFDNLSGTMSTSDTTQLNNRSARLYFNANGGIGSMPALSADFEGWVTVPACTFTRSGYTFTKWNTASDGSGTAVDPGTFIISLTADFTLYAQWTKNQSTISFDTAGGSPIDPITQDKGTAVTPPANPTRAGYSFDGWMPAVPAIMPENDMTCVAQWRIPTDPSVCRTIHFDPGGGSWGYDPYLGYGEGEMPSPPPVTREGYVFSGWVPSVPAYCPVDDITCVAQWTANSYNITFDAAGGTGGEVQTLVYGTALSAPAVTRAGYTFIGWSPSLPETVPAADTTYTAQWDRNMFRLSFNANGGTGEMDYHTMGLDGGVTVPNCAFTRTGYSFSGWNTAANGSGDSVEVGTILYLTYDLTLFAQWTVNNYIITFNANGGTGGTGPAAMDYGSALTAPTVVKTGYTFMGWDPEVPATVPANDQIYTAQWTGNTYTVSFNAGSGTVSPTDKVVTYGNAYGDLPVPTLEGFVFKGWWTESGTEVTGASTVSIARDHTLYSRWDIAYHTLTLKLNNGTNADYLSLSLEYKVRVLFDYFYSNPAGGDPEIPDPNLYYITYDYEYYVPSSPGYSSLYTVGYSPPTRSGYTFVGWSESPAGSSISYSTTIENTDITMYAVWVSNHKSTIVFDSNGGTAVAPITQDEGTAVTLPQDPVKAGYIFAGWSPAVPAIIPGDDVTCVAQWRLLGDIDNNGSVTAVDALMALQGSSGEFTLSAIQMLLADANHDGRTSAIDALILLHAASGLIIL